MANGGKKIINKKFAKSSFRLPQMATQLAQQYNVKPVSWWPRWRFRILLLVFFAVIFGLTYAPIFRIQNIIVDNVSSKLTRERILEIVQNYTGERKYFILPQNNLLLFSPNAAIRNLRQELYIEEIEFDRHWPNVLRITIKENLIIGLLRQQERLYTLDKRGVVIQQVPIGEEEPELTIIEKANLTNVNIGQKVIDTAVTDFIVALVGEWSAKNVPVSMDYLLISEDNLPTLTIVTDEGWTILVSIMESPSLQAEAIRRLITERIKEDRANLDYIDVRFGNKLFFKLKN
ncbi:MAG: FtsQ-type POTRA domain-containing protein [Patescibacteria group bacterium]